MRVPFRTEREASKERGRVFMVAVGLIGIGFMVLLGVIAFNAPNSIPGRAYYTIEAEFANADNITPHSQVRLGGRLVGQIIEPRVEDGLAVVDLQMDPGYGPLLSDTRVEVRPRSPVGVRYVDIEPGTKGRPLEDGERIPAAQTSATTPLDQVLGTFDPETKRATQDLLRGLGGGVAGRGEDISETLAVAPETLKDAESVLGAVADREGATRGLIRGSATAADAADPVRSAIAEGFAPEAQALRPFSERADSVHSTLEEAPSTLATLDAGLAQVDPLVDELGGFARNVQPALAAAPAALGQTAALLDEAQPRLTSATKTVELADRAVAPTLGLLSAVRPVLPNLERALSDATPLVTRLGRHGCDFINWGVRWSSMMGFGNGGGGVLRFNVVTPTPEAFFGAAPALENNPAIPVRDNPYPEPCVAGNEVGG